MKERFEAVILAGGKTPLELVERTGQTNRALIEMHGRPLIAYVLQALQEVEAVDGIYVVGNEETVNACHKWHAAVKGIAARDKVSENVLAGLRAARSPQALLCTCDIPLVTGDTFREFVQAALQRDLEAAYPVVRRSVMEAAFPGGRRTYARSSDGAFTGGNAFLLPTANIQTLEQLIEKAYGARKNPIALSRLLGAGFLAKTLSGRVSVAELEAKVGGLLGCHGGAIEMRDAAIAFDVDKISDYEVAEKQLKASASQQDKPAVNL